MAAEEALRKFCLPSLVTEYDALGRLEKDRFIEAMLASQREILFLSKMQQIPSKVDRVSLSDDSRPSRTDQIQEIQCPLARALLEFGVSPVGLQENELLESCRMALRRWGTEGEGPIFFKLFWHKRSIEQYRRSTAYRNAIENDSSEMMASMRTDSSVVKTGSSRADWVNLKSINIRDLRLFGTRCGCCLEGKIVGEAFLAIVGGKLLLQDSEGDCLAVHFYNVLPDGVRGRKAEPLLNEKFPVGATIRIAEPFLKILADGSRGVRVDNPAEIKVDRICSEILSEEDSLMSKKQDGNVFHSRKQYNVAIDVYTSALRETDFVPTILSNRSQAFISVEDWGQALLDAAASLTIRPDSPKTWKRYHLCATKLQQTIGCENNREIIEAVLNNDTPFIKEPARREANPSQGEISKQEGNGAFRRKQFHQAIGHYSQALQERGDTVRALLCNWAICALEIESYNDAFAAAVASLRIGMDEKAVYRLSKGLCFLGEYELAIRILSLYPGTPALKTLLGQVKKSSSFLAKKNELFISAVSFDIPQLLSPWIGPIESYMTPTMGRGVRATRNIMKGEVVLIDRVLAWAEVTDKTLIAGLKRKGVDSSSTVKLKSDLVHRCQDDAVLSNIIGLLADGTKQKPLAPLHSLLRAIDSCPALLPGRFLPHTDSRELLTAEAISAIVSTNIFGSWDADSGGPEMSPVLREMRRGSVLYSVVSMINHSQSPSCTCISLGEDDRAVFVVTNCDVKKGSELYIRYHEDDKVVSNFWNFDQNS